ncbi:integrin alpha FG-GAP repeat-containing protein 2, partial [Podila humilis]
TTSTSATSAAPVATPAAGSDTPDGVRSNDYSASRLTLEEKKRWALDGQIHSLSVTKNASTGLPILLVAQPGLKFVMVDHAGMMSEPLTQVQRDPSAIRVGPDTPTRGAGGGDVATDIVCGTQYVNGQKKEIIGLMSMDGAFALHDLENNSVRLHDLDSTHKIFGFSKLNFGGGGDSATQQDHHHNTYADYSVEHKGSRRSGRSKSSFGYGWSRGRRRYENETNDETDDGGLASDDEAEDEAEDDDDEVENDDDTATETTNHRASKQNHGDGDQYSDTESRGIRQHRTRAREHRPSLLIAEPHRSRSQMNDLFVGCSWSGNTFFIDQEFNTAQYDFDGRVCAFGAGEFAVTPGRNEPCVFYVDFEDNIYVYYNLYIQTQSLDQFQNIIREDDSLIKASQQIKQAELEAEDMIENRDGISAEQITQGKDTTRTNMIKRGWTEEDMKSFIHDSLYNVNRYEDEYQRLKRLAAIERSKRAAFYAAEEAKAREKLERAQRQATDAVASASTVKAEADDEEAYAEPSRSAAGYIDPRLGRFRHGDSTITDRRRAQQGPAGFDTTVDQQLRSHSRPQSLKSSFDDRSRSRSPNSPTSPTPSPKSKRGNEKRRSSLLIKDVLSHYEGKVTPPLKSPTSPTTSSEQQFSKGHKSGTLSSGSSSGSSASLTNIMKRFSLKDIGNGSGRMSRISSAAGGGVGTGGGNASSSSSSSGGSNSTVIASHHLLGGVVLGKGKTLETRAGKSSLRVNRPVGVPRSRSSLGVMGRKHGAKSRLSHQQVRDDGSEEVDDEGLERTTVRSDGAADLDREQMIEFERSHGLRGSNRIYGERGDEEGHETDMGSQAYYPRGESRGGEGEGEYDREDDTNGVYTPSTISPMPSPGRLYSSHYTSSQYGTAEPSPSLDGSVFTLAGSLLSPSANKTGAFSAATTTASHPPSHSQGTSSSGRPSSTSTSTSRGHSRHRSGHELLDYNLAPLPTREIVASVGINSGPNSAGHSSNHDGRRSRAESVLSAGSDIGGVIVPDITLLASSFPSQSNLPLSTSEPYSHGVLMMPQDQEDEHRAFQEGHSHQQESDDHQQQRSTVFTEGGIRRPPRRSATLGSGHGSGSGSDSAAGPSKSGSKRDSSRLGKNGAGNSSSSSDIKLMPAPLPRSNQHHQRQQQGQNQEQHRQGEPPTSTGSMIMSMSSKDLPTLSSSHISFSTNTAGGGGGSQHGHGHGSSESHEGSGFVRGPSGKSPSTTSSTNASEFGSGPSSPLTANVSASAILSNPSTSNNYKGIGILSLPVTSPAGSTTSAHQYFGGSHHPTISSLSTGKSGAQTQFAHDHHDHHQRVGQHHLLEDDRMSIRSKTSLYRGRDREDVDADSLLDHESVGIGSTSVFGASPRSSLSHHHQQQQHQSRSHQTGVVSSVGSSHLVSDSLVHRLEELQRQDHEQEEKQRRKKELEKDSEQEKERDAAASKERGILKSTTSTTSAVSSSSTAAAGGPLSSSSSSSGFGHVQQQQHQQDRPTVLSRANSGTSILSVTTTTAHAQQHHNHQHHHSQSNLPLTSHGSGSGTGRTHWGEEDHDSAKRLKNRLGLGQGL